MQNVDQTVRLGQESKTKKTSGCMEIGNLTSGHLKICILFAHFLAKSFDFLKKSFPFFVSLSSYCGHLVLMTLVNANIQIPSKLSTATLRKTCTTATMNKKRQSRKLACVSNAWIATSKSSCFRFSCFERACSFSSFVFSSPMMTV
eukprot:698864-Rhodomonas_salina.1